MKRARFGNLKFMVTTSLAGFLIVAFQNCSQTHFTSNTGTVQSAAASGSTTPGTGPASTAPTPAPTPPTSLTCGQSGMTLVTLLTPSVVNGQSGNYIDYQVSLQTCNGQAMTFNKVQLLFDINAYIAGPYGLKYSVTDGQTTFNGTLAENKGSDLFGDTGSAYGYWSTDRLTFSTNASSVVLRIYLMGQTFLPDDPQYYGQSTATADYVIPTYISVGSALPVTQNVNFTLN